MKIYCSFNGGSGTITGTFTGTFNNNNNNVGTTFNNNNNVGTTFNNNNNVGTTFNNNNQATYNNNNNQATYNNNVATTTTNNNVAPSFGPPPAPAQGTYSATPQSREDIIMQVGMMIALLIRKLPFVASALWGKRVFSPKKTPSSRLREFTCSVDQSQIPKLCGLRIRIGITFPFPVFQYVLTDMVSDNPDELAVAAHNAYEQLQYNGHSLQHQVGHNWLHEL